MEPAPIILNVPLPLPSGEELRALIVQGAERAAREYHTWLSNEQAAAHLGCHIKTWLRLKKRLGVPVCKAPGMEQRYLRADVDAVLLALTTTEATTVIAFPSQALRKAVAA